MEFLKDFVQYFLLFFEKSSYLGVFFLMTLESTLIPIPSEIIIPPAAYLAYQGKLSLWGVILAGTLGSWAGALINYFLALKFGRPMFLRFVKRYGKYILLTEYSFQKMEKFWDQHGHISTFIGRLLPGLRHVISIPAGFARMGLFLFSFYTLLGALLWCSFLGFCGYFFGKNEVLLKTYLERGSIGIIIFCGVILGLYIWFKLKRK
ncbi:MULTISPECIES: DedA family protein [Thermodesulfobacterium]|jgi:membrane protein DedA with SNARE-associated domain|uniref:DedA family protein n=1 Tax=Thermodesulfobacterium commune TaxID=1741 RepID=A0A101FK44_9BACT|nr:DedA family protein [Thermodesulfobacterium sp.]KUK38508.1 MAG: SNARE associated Golgi protein-related protein [Thermodesulfobacterium commune]MBZ4682383.1 rane protein [Thermodesulfobacterium sp.]HAA83720.1 DedA family protein [Thermodesulfobacterium commune]HBT04557.1 DedA family protein [Thermodesulfobacterium commune]HCE80260.1 DedA family protein [Thermodesulfobacterium commune]